MPRIGTANARRRTSMSTDVGRIGLMTDGGAKMCEAKREDAET